VSGPVSHRCPECRTPFFAELPIASCPGCRATSIVVADMPPLEPERPKEND
jgi:uncharacterized Zn finger protein (UPF0148 family)